MTAADPSLIDALDADDRVRISSSGSFLDAEAVSVDQ